MSEPKPYCWVIPGDDQADMNGWISARVDQWGEFTKPVYDQSAIAALEARCRELEEALRDCYARWQWFIQPETPEPPVFDMERIAKLLTAPETACEHHWMPATQDGSLAIIGRGCSKCGAWETSEANRGEKQP